VIVGATSTYTFAEGKRYALSLLVYLPKGDIGVGNRGVGNLRLHRAGRAGAR
jgi:hypothetical protein